MDLTKKNKVFLNYYLLSDDEKVTDDTPLVNVNMVDKSGHLSMIIEDELDLINKTLKFLKPRTGSVIVTNNPEHFVEIINKRYEFLTQKPLDFDWNNYDFFSIRDYKDGETMYAFGMEDYLPSNIILERCLRHDFQAVKSEMRKRLVLMSKVYHNIEHQNNLQDIRINIYKISEKVKKTDLVKRSLVKIDKVDSKQENVRIDPVTGERL